MANRRKIRVNTALDGTHYSGKLAEPIIIPSRLHLVGALRAHPALSSPPYSASDFFAEKACEKIPLLFEQFGLANGNWQGLALKLAIAHVPGFQIGKTVGRRRNNSDWEIMSLLDDWRQEHPEKSLADAIRWATKGDLKGMKVETVRRTYSRAKRKWDGIRSTLFQLRNQ